MVARGEVVGTHHEEGDKGEVPVVGGRAHELEVLLLRQLRTHVVVKVEEQRQDQRRDGRVSNLQALAVAESPCSRTAQRGKWSGHNCNGMHSAAAGTPLSVLALALHCTRSDTGHLASRWRSAMPRAALWARQPQLRFT